VTYLGIDASKPDDDDLFVVSVGDVLDVICIHNKSYTVLTASGNEHRLSPISIHS
jgi:hypothetical protein